MSQQELDAPTMKPTGKELPEPLPYPMLTVIHHPDPGRVGEVARLRDPIPVLLSRRAPDFAPVRGGPARPLSDLFISRQPLLIEGHAARLKLSVPGGDGSHVQVDGVSMTGPLVLDRDALRRGLVITLSDRVVLLLHLTVDGTTPERNHGLVGESHRMRELCLAIERVARRHVPVLLRGESGTGKELIARAIKNASDWASPYVAVNMAAITPTVAASELFGAVEGAFTGAVKHAGYFGQARGGTLFLDEVGATPHDVQSMLLRALESGEVQAVGASEPRTVKVRIIAATDADLEDAVAEGEFTQPLLQRLGAPQIRVPALRERREDLGRLLVHLFSVEGRPLTAASSEPGDGGSQPWLSAALVTRLALYSFPGNVRELRNLVRTLVIFSGDDPSARLDEAWTRRLEADAQLSRLSRSEAASGAAERAEADELSDERVIEVFRATRYNVNRAAALLGVARNTFYKRAKRMGLFRKVGELPQPDVMALGAELKWNWELMADRLFVSAKALKDCYGRLRPAPTPGRDALD